MTKHEKAITKHKWNFTGATGSSEGRGSMIMETNKGFFCGYQKWLWGALYWMSNSAASGSLINWESSFKSVTGIPQS